MRKWIIAGLLLALAMAAVQAAWAQAIKRIPGIANPPLPVFWAVVVIVGFFAVFGAMQGGGRAWSAVRAFLQRRSGEAVAPQGETQHESRKGKRTGGGETRAPKSGAPASGGAPHWFANWMEKDFVPSLADIERTIGELKEANQSELVRLLKRVENMEKEIGVEPTVAHVNQKSELVNEESKVAQPLETPPGPRVIPPEGGWGRRTVDTRD